MNPKIKVVIAEDHFDSQQIISAFLEPLDSFEVVGIAEDGEDLLDININKKPDLIIADINMPKLNGIDAISSCLKISPELQFVFITAYDQYAISAFDLHAVDYVMKPIKKERLYIALERAKNVLLSNQKVEKKQILPITVDRTSHFIHFSRIVLIEKDSRKTIIHTVDQKYETNESLDTILQKLNHDFFRTHRSFIVNLNYVSHLTFEGDTHFVHFRNYSHYAHVSKLQKNKLYHALSFENSK
ncbi:LytR/AlgR family response regulator transcription factor [Metabacillus sp. B2-18]|uniref:LytR/AlgR family response regulator transcription factor n=1 Tax=Metabacillus sp. B2-18 TaxID=2897333 RepID=UPI001E4BDCEC|nr:LytTR family DNA-binding domain-containing protein [Metabacillus sp. B2-18]UGB30247.1 LytTR family DNA-binding domain-containing protein [Metabacillus sp. B2-18]